MRASGDLLMAALHSASEELSGKGVRFEVFARLGESTRLSRGASGILERCSSREFGVGCRVSGRDGAGFGAASGSGARAGREAARIALGTMLPAPDPLPPRSVLGATGTSLPHDVPESERIEEVLGDVAARMSGGRHGVMLVQARVLAGTSAAALATGEGFHAGAKAGGTVMELLVAPPEGPWRHFHFAAPAVSDLDPVTIAERVQETALLATRGSQPVRQLADVLLAPAVAAPIVEALVRYLTAASDKNREVRVSGAWHLTDDRLGPEGLLPLPWDGEGLPARRIDLIRSGEVGERLATWELAERFGGRPGGAVRPSYRRQGRQTSSSTPIPRQPSRSCLAGWQTASTWLCRPERSGWTRPRGGSECRRRRSRCKTASLPRRIRSSSCGARSGACSPVCSRLAPTARASPSAAPSRRHRSSSAASRSSERPGTGRSGDALG